MNNIFLEQFNLDPLVSVGDLVELEYVDASEYIKEAQTDTTKKNIFQRLWEMIKKICSAIAKALRNFGRWLKSKFRPTKSANACVSSIESINIKPNKANKEESKHQEVSYTIISNGVEEPHQFTMTAASELAGELTKDGIQFDFNLRGYTGWAISQTGKTGINAPKNPPKASAGGILLGLKYIYLILTGGKQNISSHVINLCKSIESYLSSPNDASLNQIKNDMDAISPNKVDNAVGNRQMIIGFDDFEYVDKVMVAIERLLSLTPDPSNTNQDIINVLNQLSKIMIYIQFGMNEITRTITTSYRVSEEYYGSCTKPDQLDQAIFNMIEARIPTKYIIDNTVALLKKDTAENVKRYIGSPGQGRAFLYGGKGPAYKFATNRLGIHDNKVEYNTYSKLPEQLKKYLINIPSIEKNGCVIETEYITPVEDAERIDRKVYTTDRFADSVKQSARDNGYAIADIGKHNIGIDKDDHYKIYDFGQLTKVGG